ncbi:hypothetical protein AX769_13355 [Frondihabitans sp. PAMC 28766]|uniref:septation protein SepH n=1 Tax=Frondihabitans sp. PAMC 28766 TaxID=1795630 RepID=UPI00078D8202|nr:septation protein SepH [Frondihabitans sp. PAMC 28766]AMM20939.1 hypothetical protein AX769_13355 [Frondihabitans sp. PAMC 28766]
MQDLKVIGVESGALLVATDAGSEYRLPVTLSLQTQLRQANPDLRSTSASAAVQKISPRDIQASIRAGRTAEQVATDTGAEIDYVRRFEGPVLDERGFVLERARAVPVSVVSADGAIGELSKFGDVIDSRLDEAEASDRDWTSYKDPATGWVVHVTYTAAEVEREATWRFEPKKQGLAPLDGDAHTLSRQDGSRTTLVPRLRAVDSTTGGVEPLESADEPAPAGSSAPNEAGRFDSGAFEPAPVAPETLVPEPPLPFDRTRDGRTAASFAAMNRAPENAPEHNQTADLLEALRRRRGEREAARFDDDHASTPESSVDSRAAHPSTGSMRVIDVPLDDFETVGTVDEPTPETPEPPRTTKPLATHPTASRRVAPRRQAPTPPPAEEAPEQQRAKQGGRARKGRAAMPSWDEIVFGARSDDDPA